MSKQTALVSGASGNLGKAVVEHFLSQNWQVCGLVHHQGEDSDREHYREFEVDLTDEAATEQCVEACKQQAQSIDVAVLTAGGFAMGDIAETSLEELKKMYRLNFETAYNLMRPLLQHMKKEGKGKLFFIGSKPGMDTRKGNTTVAYSLSKSLLFQLANMINADTNNTGVEAFVVVPGTIDTPQNRKAVPKADFSQWEKPEDIAELIGKYAEKTQSVATENSVILVDSALKELGK